MGRLAANRLICASKPIKKVSVIRQTRSRTEIWGIKIQRQLPRNIGISYPFSPSQAIKLVWRSNSASGTSLYVLSLENSRFEPSDFLAYVRLFLDDGRQTTLTRVTTVRTSSSSALVGCEATPINTYAHEHKLTLLKLIGIALIWKWLGSYSEW